MKTLLVLLLPFIVAMTGVPKPERKLPGDEVVLPRPQAIGLTMVADSSLVGGICCHSPAAQAGLIGGDRIVEIDGKPIRDLEDFQRALYAARYKPSIEVATESLMSLNGVHFQRTVTIRLPRGWWLPSRG